MKRRIRFAAILMSMMLAFSTTSAYAFDIGELLGWGSWGEEDNSSDKQDKKSSYDEQAGRKDQNDQDDDSEDYYESMDLEEDASYDTKSEVCAYLVQFHCLPSNYMTKKEARNLGWEGGALHLLIEGKCIGGDYFGNYDENLPVVNGREYHECDIDTLSGSGRGAERIVYSGDDDNGEWNIYYTDDHYETFTLLWGEDEYDE